MPPVAVLLSAATFARFRHGEFGLFRRPTVPAHIREVAADSGGFVAARRFGDYDFLAIQYVEWLYSFGPRWAATMDYPVEPELAADERAVRERQERTTELATFLWDQFPDAPWAWVPTVQGWSVDDYARHAEDLAPLVMEMRHEYNPWSWDRDDTEAVARAARQFHAFRVGVGTLCRRADPYLIREIVQSVAEALPGVPLHLWGVKVSTLRSVLALPAEVISIDSAAWNGRFGRQLEQGRIEQHRFGLSQREHAARVALPRYIGRVRDALLAPKQLALDVRLPPAC